MTPATLRVHPAGHWFELQAVAGATPPRVDLGKRPQLAKILARLVQAHEGGGRVVEPAELIEALWPAEALHEKCAQRLHTAISTLRQMGLGEALMLDRKFKGYRLDANLAVAR